MTKFPFPLTAAHLLQFQKTEEAYYQLVETFAKECLLYFKQEPIVAPATMEFLTQEEKSDKYTWYYTLSHQYSYYIKHNELDNQDLSFLTLMDIIRYPEEYEGALSVVSKPASAAL